MDNKHAPVEKINHDYFMWLVSLVQLGGTVEDLSYLYLLEHLHNTEFYWIIDMDENRASDALDIRKAYEEIGDRVVLNRSATVLEVLIAVSMRIDFLLNMPEEHDGIPDIFLELITNLGLDYYNDEVYWMAGARDEIDDILNKFMSRRYTSLGWGGILPLSGRNDHKDQRKLDLWYQINEYLMDRYYVDVMETDDIW